MGKDRIVPVRSMASVPGRVLLFVALVSVGVTALALALPRLVTDSGASIGLVGRSDRAFVTASRRVELDAPAHLEEPDVLETWTEWREFLAVQDELVLAAKDPPPWFLEAEDGSRVRVEQAPVHPARLPFEFWLQLSTAAFCVVAAELTHRLGTKSAALFGYRVAGWGVAFAAWASAIYSTRSLAIPSSWFETIHAINTLAGPPVFGAGTCVLLALQPRRLFRAWPLLLTGPLVTGLFWLIRVDAVGPAASVYGVIVAYVVAIFVLLGLQRRGLDRDPVGHAVWRLQALAVLGGIGFFVVAQGLPVFFGHRPWATQGATLVGFAVMFALMSFGAARLGLFSVSRWWGRAWLGLFAATLVVALDFALASALPIGGFSTALALGLVGWLYLPLRGWLFRRVSGRHRDSWAADVKWLAGARHLSEHLLRFEEVLHARYRPIGFALGERAERTELSETGEAIVVPWPTGDRSYRLTSKQGGAALFDETDVEEIEALLDVARGLIEGLAAYQEGERAERERIRRDLHDHLGARLSRLAKESTGTELEGNVRGIVNELRHVSSALLGEEAALEDVFLELEAEARAIARAFGLSIRFSFSPARGNFPRMLGGERADLLAVVREGLTNVARHGDPTRVALCGDFDGNEVSLRITSGVASRSPEESSSRDVGLALGSGLRNLERRAELRGGRLALSAGTDEFVLEVRLPKSGSESTDERRRPESRAAE